MRPLLLSTHSVFFKINIGMEMRGDVLKKYIKCLSHYWEMEFVKYIVLIFITRSFLKFESRSVISFHKTIIVTV